ncbi:MAG: hypothetical protein ACRD5K_14475, partial [Candidatus Acidiferrales bacterium]
MQTRVQPIVTLVLIAPVLTEIVSGNTPPHALLHPSVDIFLIAVYSLPLLVIRELTVRWRLRTVGVFLLGLAYGLFNEGLVAQTLIRYQHAPIANFDLYLCAAGVNFSWAALILPWHALMAVTFPVALLGLWFPSCAQSNWLGTKALLVLVTVVGGGSVFLGVVRRPEFQMRVFLFAMAVLVGCAWLCRGEVSVASGHGIRRWRAFALGAIFYVALFLGATLLAGRKAPAELYFLFVAVLLLILGWIGRRYKFERLPNAGLGALGAYFSASLFNGVGGLMRHSREAVLCGAILSLIFLYL